MPKFATERRVRHSAGQMFDLVADVETYPAFVPLCDDLVMRGRADEADGTVILIVDMTVAYKIVRETFTTRDVLNRDALTIDVTCPNGPFRRFDSRWAFAACEDGCLVRFTIDYEFRSRMLATLMGAIFDRYVRHLVDAFQARADVVYGETAGAG